MSVLLVMLASGWTILFQEIDVDEKAEIYIPIVALVVIIHIMTAALTFIDVDAYHKYHDFAGVQGMVIMATKVGLWLFFAYKAVHTLDQTKSKGSESYLWKLYGLGSAYLLSTPFSILVTYLFPPYDRQEVYDVISHLLMFVTNIFLLYEVSYRKSSWFRANLDSLGILPMK